MGVYVDVKLLTWEGVIEKIYVWVDFKKNRNTSININDFE